MKKLQLRLVDSSKFELDNNKSIALIDEICAAALNLTNSGPMGYTQFIQTRDEFKKHIETVAKCYRIVEIE